MELADYERYVLENNFTDSKRVKYYSGWVRKYFKLNLSEQLSSREKIQQFREYLNVDERLEDWQRDQAQKAVEIYLNMYLEVVEHIPKGDLTPEYNGILESVRTAIRVKHYAYRTEQTYIDWIKRYFHYCIENGADFRAADSVKLFLSLLATKLNVAASTQNQALCSIIFMFKNVFGSSLGDLNGTVRAKKKKNIPAVLSVDEVKLLFEQVEGTKRMFLELIYGCGLRISELTRLRVLNLDFDNRILILKETKGGSDRSLRLPKSLIEPLRVHLKKVKQMHDDDLAAGNGEVYLPHALSRKYPHAGREWKWQYVFPSSKLAVDPRSGKIRRHHILDKTIQNLMRKAVRDADITKKVTVHTLRHSYATHLLMSGVNIRQIQELLGHKNVETTMIYTHAAKDISRTPESPLDML